MITKDEKRSFKNYPAIIKILSVKDLPSSRKRLILSTIHEFNTFMHAIKVSTNIKNKNYFYSLIKQDFIKRLQDGKLLEIEKSCLRNYIIAKGRKYQ